MSCSIRRVATEKNRAVRIGKNKKEASAHNGSRPQLWWLGVIRGVNYLMRLPFYF